MNRNDVMKRLEGFDDYVENLREIWRVYGLSISIVKDGELIHSKGYGMRDPEKRLEMNADTLYRIASNTKAFTSMALAILVDEGKLDWDKPVRNYIPYFRLKDPYASENVTPRDLLCHRTGLPAHDGALHQFKTRKEKVENLQYLDSSYPMRTKLQYNNLMYMTAGHLVEVITGQSWESFVQERIFMPLGMEKTNFSFFKSRLSGNFAECYYNPYASDEILKFETNREVDPEYIYPGSPAGAINSTANEMAKWMMLQVNKGEYEGKRIVSEKVFNEMHSPQMIDNWNSPYEEQGQSSCGFGWFVWGYRGQKLLLHGGFFGSQVYIVPHLKMGITILPTVQNVGIMLRDVIAFNIIDRMLGLNQINWSERYLMDRKKTLEKERAELAKVQKVSGTSLSHVLTDYCGVFTHPAYGKFEIRVDGAKLVAVEGEDRNELRHYHYDTFEFLRGNGEPEFKVTFHTDATGNVNKMSVPLESAVEDIVFKREV